MLCQPESQTALFRGDKAAAGLEKTVLDDDGVAAAAI